MQKLIYERHSPHGAMWCIRNLKYAKAMFRKTILWRFSFKYIFEIYYNLLGFIIYSEK